MVEKVLKATGELVDMDSEVVEELDSWTLCGARHTLQVGVTKHQQVLTPFDDYFVVAFHGEDTSGGGKAMELLIALLTPVIDYAKDVGNGVETLFDDPDKYSDVMVAGREAAQDDYNECIEKHGRWSAKCMGQLGKSGAAAGFMTVGQAGGAVVGWVKDPCIFNCAETDYSLYAEQRENASRPNYTPFGTENQVFAGDDTDCDSAWKEWTGGCYHGLEANTHKIRIEITNTFDGKTIKKYDSELAGCPAQYNPDDEWCFNGSVYKRFFINSPGTWTIKITPLATATCNMLDYEHTWTYEVPEPEDWQPSAITAMSNNVSAVLQNAGLPVYISPLAVVGGISLLGATLLYSIYKKGKN
jgi:hypothetical protein